MQLTRISKLHYVSLCLMASPENHIGHEQQDQHGQRDQHVSSREYAVSQDAQDPLRQIRDEFLIPSTADLQARTLSSLGTRFYSR